MNHNPLNAQNLQNMLISFTDYDDMVLACETEQPFNLGAIRARLDEVRDDDDAAEVVYYGRDGNDSIIVDTGEGFAWFVAANLVRYEPGPDMGEIVAWGKTETMREALRAVFDITLIDNETR